MPDMIMAVAAPCWPEYESSVDAVAPGASVVEGFVSLAAAREGPG
jgi:hypothetical protein